MSIEILPEDRMTTKEFFHIPKPFPEFIPTKKLNHRSLSTNIFSVYASAFQSPKQSLKCSKSQSRIDFKLQANQVSLKNRCLNAELTNKKLLKIEEIIENRIKLLQNQKQKLLKKEKQSRQMAQSFLKKKETIFLVRRLRAKVC